MAKLLRLTKLLPPSKSAYNQELTISRTTNLVCKRVYMAFIFDKKILEFNRNKFLVPFILFNIKKYKIKFPAVMFILTDKSDMPIYYIWYSKLDKTSNFSYNFKNDKQLLQKKAVSFFKKTKLPTSIENACLNVSLDYWTLYFNDGKQNIPSNIKIDKKVEYYTIFDGVAKR